MSKERWIGIILLAASVFMTCINEQRHIRSIKSLDEGLRMVISLPEPVSIPANNDKLVHFNGLITTDPSLQTPNSKETRSPYALDPVFGIAARGVRLYRTVEMLQWVETTHTIAGSGGGMHDDVDLERGEVTDDASRERTYTYDLRWRSDSIDSSRFNDISYRNPSLESWIYRSKAIDATLPVVVGDFRLSSALIDQIQLKKQVELDPPALQVMRNVLNTRLGSTVWKKQSALQQITQEDNYFYLLKDGLRPELGDLRISFQVIPAHRVTISGRQEKMDIVPYVSSVDEPLLLLENGDHTAAELYDIKLAIKYQHNRFFRMFTSTLGFISVLVLHPVLCQRLGPNFAAVQKHLVAVFISGGVTLIVSGLNWLVYRPLWGITLIMSGFIPSFILIILKSTKSKSRKIE